MRWIPFLFLAFAIGFGALLFLRSWRSPESGDAALQTSATESPESRGADRPGAGGVESSGQVQGESAPEGASTDTATEDRFGGEQEGTAPPVPVPQTEDGKAVPRGSGEVLAMPAGGARIALVIDDLGRELSDIERLSALKVPISFAVLPFETRTSEVVRRLQDLDLEILLHLPMEPSGQADPGPGALSESMSRRDLEKALEAALAAVPGAAGVNNHMGSRLSSNPRAMGRILDIVGRHDLFYLDSRTSAETVGYRMALEKGIPTAERQVFLDRDPSPAAIRSELRRLAEVAKKRGAAIGIGHPYPTTLRILEEEIPGLVEQGFELVPVSYLLDRSSSPPLE